MRTNSGLIELDSGWTLGVGAVAPGRVRMLLQYAPGEAFPAHGVKDLRLSLEEVSEVMAALERAAIRAGGAL